MDRRAAVEFGIPSLLLMENAGAETVREILAAFPGIGGLRVLVLCGRGNNGGDGFVIARRLLGRGISVRTVLLARRDAVQGDARINLEILEKLGAPPVEISAANDLPGLRECLASADVVVDAILGTGARGPARDILADAIDAVNRSGRPVVAVDIPSGLGADRVEASGAGRPRDAHGDLRRAETEPDPLPGRGPRRAGPGGGYRHPADARGGRGDGRGAAGARRRAGGVSRPGPRGAQGELWTRPGRRRIGGQDRRGGSGGPGRPADRRRPGDAGGAGQPQ